MFCKNGAALVAAMMAVTLGAVGCSYGLTGECAGGSCTDTSVVSTDVGKDSPVLGDGATDASSTDSAADAQSETTDVAAEVKDTTVDVTCPPEGKPERTEKFSAKDGPTCGTFLEKKFAEVVGGGKEWYAVSCKTFGNANNCSAMTEVYSFKYVPETWTDAPKEQLTAYAGSSYVGVTMPNNKDAWITQYALVSCDENECVGKTPKPAFEDIYGELKYNFVKKQMTIKWTFLEGGGTKPMVFKRVE